MHRTRGKTMNGGVEEDENTRALNDIIKQSDFHNVTRNAWFGRISANKHVDDWIAFGVNLSAVRAKKYNVCGSTTAYASLVDCRVPTDCDGNDCGCEHLTVEYHLFCIVIVRRCTLSFGTPTKSSTRLWRAHARCEDTQAAKLNRVYHTFGIV